MTEPHYVVIGESNGHKWIKPEWLDWQSCLACGIVRRGDDKNKPCPGKVFISLRQTET